MNYQQRNRALSEGIRERCQRTGGNPNMSWGHDVDFTSSKSSLTPEISEGSKRLPTKRAVAQIPWMGQKRIKSGGKGFGPQSVKYCCRGLFFTDF